MGLVVDAEGLVCVLDKLVDGESGVVGLHNGVRDLGAGHHGVGVHDPVRVLLPDLRDQKSSHAGASAAAKGVGELKALKAVAALALLANDVEHAVHQLRTLCVVALGPVVASPALSEDEVVRPEDLAIGSAPHRVHRAWLEVDKDGPGNVLAPGGLVVVHVDPLQLQVRGARIAAAWVDAVLIRDDFPELSSDLVAALASLQVDDLPHLQSFATWTWTTWRSRRSGRSRSSRRSRSWPRVVAGRTA